MVISIPSLQILEKQHAWGLPGSLWEDLGLNAESNWKCGSVGYCWAQFLGLSSGLEAELCCRCGGSMKSTWGEKRLHRSSGSPWYMESHRGVWGQPGELWGEGCVALTAGLLIQRNIYGVGLCYFSVKFVPQQGKTMSFKPLILLQQCRPSGVNLGKWCKSGPGEGALLWGIPI